MKTHPNKGQFVKGERVERTDIKCLTCGKIFKVAPSGISREYCSKKCSSISEVRRNKISLKNRDIVHTREWNKKVSEAAIRRYDLIGRKEMPRSYHYHSKPEYKKYQKEVFERDGWTCKKYGTKVGRMIAHHILNWYKYPKLRYDASNGITLSERAHREFHHKYGNRNNNQQQIDEFLRR